MYLGLRMPRDDNPNKWATYIFSDYYSGNINCKITDEDVLKVDKCLNKCPTPASEAHPDICDRYDCCAVIGCLDYPHYKGIRHPRTPCPVCWTLYIFNRALVDGDINAIYIDTIDKVTKMINSNFVMSAM